MNFGNILSQALTGLFGSNTFTLSNGQIQTKYNPGLIANIGTGISSAINYLNPQNQINRAHQVQAQYGYDPSGLKSPKFGYSAANIPQQGTVLSATKQQLLSTPQPTQSPQFGQQLMQTASGLGRNPDVNAGLKPISPAVKQAILGASQEFGVPSQLLFDIGYSEGGFRPDAANQTPAGQAVGIPRGLFQFTPGTWEGDLKNYASQPNSSLRNWLVNGQLPDRNDPTANARAAAYLIKFGQLGRWDASKSNWGRFYSPQELKSYYSQTPGRY